MSTLMHKVFVLVTLIAASVSLGSSKSPGQENRPPELRGAGNRDTASY